MTINIVTVESQQALTIRDTCSFAELSAKFDEIYSEIDKYLLANSIKITGCPFGIYHSFSDERVDVEAGIPVAGEPTGEGRIKPMKTYSGKAVNTTFTGHYSKLNEAWGVFAKLVDAEGYKLAGPCFEVYVTDIRIEHDSSKWITELYTPIE
jgi:effector-binding domain-containing protein